MSAALDLKVTDENSTLNLLLLKFYTPHYQDCFTGTPEQRPRLYTRMSNPYSQNFNIFPYSVTRTPPSDFRLASIACNSRTLLAISMGVAAAKRAFKGGAILNVRLILE